MCDLFVTTRHQRVKDLTVLLNVKTQTSSHNFKTNRNKCLLQENLDTQVQSQFSFQINSPKVSMLYNHNNFSNKSNSFIPQFSSNLTTLATSDPDLKSTIYSTYKNSKTLKLFSKSSIVDSSIDEILTQLGNESMIHNGSVLFPPIEKQEISSSQPIVPFKSSSLICHEKNRSKEGKKYALQRIFRKRCLEDILLEMTYRCFIKRCLVDVFEKMSCRCLNNVLFNLSTI